MLLGDLRLQATGWITIVLYRRFNLSMYYIATIVHRSSSMTHTFSCCVDLLALQWTMCCEEGGGL